MFTLLLLPKYIFSRCWDSKGRELKFGGGFRYRPMFAVVNDKQTKDICPPSAFHLSAKQILTHS